MKGYVKDFRKELNSDIWLMPPLYHRVWQYLKYSVNHEPNQLPMRDGSTCMILPGQHLTSLRNIAKGIGWYEGLKWKEPNPKTIKVILDWMIKQGMIQVNSGQGNRQYTLITLVNWEFYQSKEHKGNAKVTQKKQFVDINNNDKNEKNIKHTCPFSEIQDLFNTICASLPAVQIMTDSRKEKLSKRWVKMPDINEWKRLFEIIECTPFLKGQGNKGWKATFDWLIKNDTNIIGVLEGKYGTKSTEQEKYQNIIT